MIKIVIIVLVACTSFTLFYGLGDMLLRKNLNKSSTVKIMWFRILFQFLSVGLVFSLFIFKGYYRL